MPYTRLNFGYIIRKRYINKKMNENTYFYEEQKMKLKWVYALLYLLFGLQFWIVYQQEILDKPFGNNPAPSFVYLIGAVVLVLILTMVQKMTLFTTVDQNGIHIKIKPFHLKGKFIPWENIEKIYIRKYKPVREFGGWGIRYWLGGKAYNMYGNKGLQMILNSGSKILIGTQKPVEFEQALKQIDSIKSKLKKAETQ